MNIIGSTFSNNSVISGGTGGGLNNSSTVSITNSTIASNTAGGGFANAGGGKATLTNNTIATNTGGGIVGGGTVNIAQSIVANNSGSNCSFHPADYGYNLESGKDCGFSAGTGDLQNTNPQLASALANNGGPTSTLALLDSSPAIDKIPTSVCAVTTDQRGVSRPQGPACDIGAFESLVPSILTLTNDANTVVPGGPFTLSGSPITINFSFTSIVKDHLGNTQGWSLLAASSGITNGITTLDLNLTALNSSSTCINGTCTPVTFTAVSPLTTTPTPFLTAGNAGQTIVVTGDYTNVIGGQFTIPIGASAGVYTGFISVTLANVF
jgi:hypothetical protein